MARELRKQEVADAVKAFAAMNGLETSINDAGGFTILKGGELGTDIQVGCNGGKLVCSDDHLREKLSEIIMEMPVEAKAGRLPENKSIMPKGDRSSDGGQMVPVSSVLTLEKVRDYFCKSATDEECQFALEVCAIRGLNPFKRDCFFVKYGGSDPKLEIIVAKDYFMKKAMSHPDFQYFKAGVTVQKGEEVKNVDRYYAYPGETLLGGWAEAKRKSIEVPFRAEIPLSGFVKDNKFWRAQPGPGHMIRKCAGSTVLREAYPEEFGGLYDEAELGIDPSKEVPQ